MSARHACPDKRSGRGRLRRRGFRITREGRIFVLVCVGVGIAAVNTGNNLLYLLLGLMLSVLLVSGVLSDLVLHWVAVERRPPRRLFVGRAASSELTLHNRKRFLPSLSIAAYDVAAGEPEQAPAYFLRVAARARASRATQRVPTRRGALQLDGVRLRTRYPFGLIEKDRFVPLPDSVVVYPALVPVEAPDAPARLEGRERSLRRLGRGPEIAGVRAYRAGDESRDVHWRRSASVGALIVREREREARASTTLVLDDRRADGHGGAEGLERAIEVTASLCLLLVAREVAVEVITASGASPRVGPGEPLDPLLRFLALLPGAPADAPPPRAPEGAYVIDGGGSWRAPGEAGGAG